MPFFSRCIFTKKLQNFFLCKTIQSVFKYVKDYCPFVQKIFKDLKIFKDKDILSFIQFLILYKSCNRPPTYSQIPYVFLFRKQNCKPANFCKKFVKRKFQICCKKRIFLRKTFTNIPPKLDNKNRILLKKYGKYLLVISVFCAVLKQVEKFCWKLRAKINI